MIVNVYTYYADMCGNCDVYFYGRYECNSLDEAQRIFRLGAICGFKVEEHVEKVKKLPKEPQNPPKEQEMRRRSFW